MAFNTTDCGHAWVEDAINVPVSAEQSLRDYEAQKLYTMLASAALCAVMISSIGTQRMRQQGWWQVSML